MNKSSSAVIMLGSNLGSRSLLLEEARNRIGTDLGTIKQTSEIYLSEAWGMENAPEFLNQAILLETGLPAPDLMKELLQIESRMGRDRTRLTGSRNIDLDMILYDNEVLSSDMLILPHPRFHLRRFNLVPLVEIIPDWKHPVLGLSMSQLLQECSDPLFVTPYHQTES